MSGDDWIRGKVMVKKIGQMAAAGRLCVYSASAKLQSGFYYSTILTR